MASVSEPTLHLDNWFSTDAQLHQLYPKSIQLLASRHWSPLHIAQMALTFLVPNEEVKVLDIGSGIGKFCLAAAYYKPFASFFGVEQRKDLIEYAETARNILGLQNAYFIHRNFTQINLKQYDHFYFYNSFFENLDDTDRIDNKIAYSKEIYNHYTHYLYTQLKELSIGTRVVTYCSWGDEIPSEYKLIESHFDNLLKFWKKI